MASSQEKSKDRKVPPRAASLQRMLEIERKQKMERMQQQAPQAASARRGASPASNSSSGSRPGLLHRRRESSVPRQDDQRLPAARSFNLAPLTIDTQPAPRNGPPQERRSKSAEAKEAAPKGPRKADRDSLPSMVKAATAHEPSSLKMVSFATGDGNQSDDSSICHSPTWDDFAKKKRKPAEEKRKRLSKQPPPAPADNRPVPNSRAMSDSVLNNQHVRQNLENAQSSQLNSAQAEDPHLAQSSQPDAVEPVEAVARSPAFIGGVRLEREREAAMKRLLNARAPSAERPASEVLSPTSQARADVSAKRETAPPISYPPTSSKTPFLKQSGNPRTRRGSFSSGIISAAGKLFGSKDKDPNHELGFSKKNESQESVQTVQTFLSSSLSRGRQVDGSSPTHARGQSYDSHERYASQKERRRGKLSLPPVTWKNPKRSQTTSMIAVPPDSARDGSFSPNRSPELGEDNFSFLERPFSPPVDSPLSPPASLSASMKAKMSPQQAPTPATPPPARKPGKKKLKDAIKTGFRSSNTTPEPTRLRRPRSRTLDTLSGIETEIPLSVTQSNPRAGTAAKNSPILSGGGAQPSVERHSAADPKDSGASSSSSHPDSESQPPSPMTTPDTSRPQSSKDNQTIRFEDLKKVQLMPQQGNVLVRNIGTSASGEQTSAYYSSRDAGSPRIDVEIPSVSQNDLLGRPGGQMGSNLLEKLPSQQFLTDELWTPSRKQLDPDQLSFTSALTSIDVKRSFKDLNSAISSPLQSPNGDVTPLSLDRDHHEIASATKMAVQKVEGEVKQVPTGFKSSHGQDFASRVSNSAFLPNLPHQTFPVRPVQSNQRLILSDDLNKQSLTPHARTDSPDAFARPSSKASAYLQEARKAAPSSPRAPSSKPSSNLSLPAAAAASLSGPRSFALSGPKGSTPPAPSPLHDAAASILDRPIAKMLVECCHCRFYQDMPSRVYEAMARPDDVVKDKKLGVSGQVTTCVKCPWCSHNMSTTCCAGYAAVVYLREKLHGP